MKHINYRLVNIGCCLIILILGYFLWPLFKTIFSYISPFLVSILLVYMLYPLFNFLTLRKVPRCISLLLIVLIIISFLAILVFYIVPIISKDIVIIFNELLSFLDSLSSKYNIELSWLEDVINSSLNSVIINMSSKVLGIFKNMITFTTKTIFVIVLFIYIMVDIDNILYYLKNKLSKKAYRYLLDVNVSMKKYVNGFLKIFLITLVEYSVSYLIIGHPSYLFLGIFAAISNFIPYVGGLLSSLLALLTSFMISKQLMVRTLITFLILAIADSYLIEPFIYSKKSKIHPLVIIISLSLFGSVFGLTGLILSIPIVMVMITLYKSYKKYQKDVEN